MAGLLGEGGYVSFSGTWSATTPATLIDIAPAGNITVGTDGRPANIITMVNADTSNTYVLCGRVKGLQENNTASFFTVLPMTTQSLQVGWEANEILSVTGFLLNLADGTAPGAGACMVGGFVSSRRH